MKEQSPSEFFNQKVIGTLKTKPLVINTENNGKKETITLDPVVFDVIDIQENIYICNKWHKEYKKIPQIISKDMVDLFVLYNKVS